MGDKEERRDQGQNQGQVLSQIVKKKEHNNKVQVQDKDTQKDLWEEKGTLFLLSHFLLYLY